MISRTITKFLFLEKALPNVEEPDVATVAQPVANHIVRMIGVFQIGDVGEAKEILTVMRENRDGCALNFDAGAFGFAHLLRFLRDAERRGLQWYCVYLATNPTLLPPDEKQDLSIGGRIFRRFRRLAFHYCGSALSPTVDPDAATAGAFASLPRSELGSAGAIRPCRFFGPLTAASWSVRPFVVFPVGSAGVNGSLAAGGGDGSVRGGAWRLERREGRVLGTPRSSLAWVWRGKSADGDVGAPGCRRSRGLAWERGGGEGSMLGAPRSSLAWVVSNMGQGSGEWIDFRPLGVRRYFWRRLLGFSGMVRSSKPDLSRLATSSLR